ncbi:apses-domain-containing protein [Rhodotorula sp. JG-1b]|nr:apses-domain-containing protein [Rhodotorula sp. JG-1b]
MSAPAPAIYKACYSGVPVYEMPCHGVAVMRRKADAWLNATQILKVAGFDKPQRTRVLEREVQKNTHEKVQGGYGKYQGTWVPMERGIALSRQYGVDRLLQPIFDFVPTADSPPLAPKHITAAPSRPRRKHDVALDLEGIPTPPPMGKGGRRSAASAATFEDLDDDFMLDGNGSGSGSRLRTPVNGGVGGGGGSGDPSNASQTPSPLVHNGDDDDGDYIDGRSSVGPSSAKRRKVASQQDHAPLTAHQQMQGLGPLRYARMILDYFVSESTQVPPFLLQPPADFDPNVVIDDDGHTALHWACAMGRIRIVKLLLSAGADIFRANSMGQTALMRSVMFTNNYDLRKFPELFELLHRSTINIDRNDRTVFHYIVDIALQKNKTQAARYYMETVLQRLADYPEEVADILNFQDEEGETALTLAARARSKRLVKLLLDNGADPKIANRDGKSAEDYILEDERFREQDINAVPVTGTAAEGLGPAGSAGANGAGSSSSAYVGAAPARLHTSETGQKVASKVIPEVASLLETLATSFDAELADKDRELVQADATIAALQREIADAERVAQQLERRAKQVDALAVEEKEREKDLEAKMGKRFRLGWEKWVRDEDQREQQYEQDGGPSGSSAEGPQPDLDAYRDLISNPPADASDRADALRARIAESQTERKRLFARLVEQQAAAGTGKKLSQYRQLVALGCGVPLDQVDAAIDALVSEMDQPRLIEILPS